MRLKDLALARPRYGFKRLTVLLKREGWQVNHKRVYRLYREEGLTVRIERRKKLASRLRVKPPAARGANERWTLDFMSDATTDERAVGEAIEHRLDSIRCPRSVGQWTRSSMKVPARATSGTSLPGWLVEPSLRRLALSWARGGFSARSYSMSRRATLQGRPDVSVVIPTFNRRDLVCEAVESALGQSMPSLEVIVVDDGSRDGTWDHLRNRYVCDRRVRVVAKPNGGAASARNRGLALVRAPFTAFLDSDDLWMPEYLERQLAVLAESGADAVLCDAACGGGTGHFELTGRPPPTSLDAVLAGGWGLPTALVVRTDVARSLRFDESYSNCEDTEFLLRFHAAGHLLAINPRRLAVWRHHGQGRKTDESRQAHVIAEIRMLYPHRAHPSARRRLREFAYGMHRHLARELIAAQCWYEARPHLAAWARRRPYRPRVLVRWLRSRLARPSPRLPPAAVRAWADQLFEVLR